MSELMYVGEKAITNGTNVKFLTIPAAIIKDVGPVKKAKIYYCEDKKEMIVKFFY